MLRISGARCKLFEIILVVALLASGTGFSWAYTIPDSRVIPWDAGVRGDIPYRTNIVNCVSSYGAHADGLDTRSSIQSCINATPTGGVAYLPAGTYTVYGGLNINKGITLRGDGMGETIIKSDSSSSGTCSSPFRLLSIRDSVGNGYSWTSTTYPLSSSGLIKGSNIITTKTPHNWSVGNYIMIDQTDDPTADPPIDVTPSCSWCSDPGRRGRPISQWGKITAIPSSTSAVIDPPLYFDYNPATAEGVRVTGYIEGVGVEDITLDHRICAGDNNKGAIYMEFAINSWLLRTEINGVGGRGLWMYRGLWNTIRSCKFHTIGNRDMALSDSESCGSSASSCRYYSNKEYGIFFGTGSTAVLTEDSMFYDNLILDVAWEGGNSGHVFAYNYAETGAAFSNNHRQARNSILGHGGHGQFILIEGNWLGGRYGNDYYFGSHSYTTLFRNKINQTVTTRFESTPNVEQSTIDFERKSWYANVVGNVLDYDGRNPTVYESTTQSDSQVPFNTYRLGHNYFYSDSSNSKYDSGVVTTILRHLNWDKVTNGVRNCTQDSVGGCQGGASDTVLPPSLYLASKPPWWGSQPWPPIGPDVQGYAVNIPAKDRFEGMPLPVSYTVTPSAGPNGSIKPDTPRIANVGTTVTFTVTPNYGFTAIVDGTCGGTLTGSTYITNPVSSNCTVTASFVPVSGGGQTRPSPPPSVDVQ